MLNRFLITVYNHDCIGQFLNNFHKIKNFNVLTDKIVIIDCSDRYYLEWFKIFIFCLKKGIRINKNIIIVRRNNLGIDQGARLDFIEYIRKQKITSNYIWQFQEHYLDNTSKKSIWPKNTINIDGKDFSLQKKADTIPDNYIIDLDYCEEIFKKNNDVQVLFANRFNIGVFQINNKSWFYTDGANFCIRSQFLLDTISEEIIVLYNSIYDGTYGWALFMEFDICRRLSTYPTGWYDLVNQIKVKNYLELIRTEKRIKKKIHQNNEKEYYSIYQDYLNKLQRKKLKNVI